MSKKVILCVDDEINVLISLREQLSEHFGNQYHYELAESAEEAWEVLEELAEEEKQVIMVISDWLMPGMKGDEFLISVREQFPKTLTFMLTGQADKEAIQRAKEQASLCGFLYKPWQLDELIKIVEENLSA
jgi:DNA-binding NtrC family response regulator